MMQFLQPRIGWISLGVTGAAGLAAHVAWSYDEAQEELKARISSRVAAAKEEEGARFAALEEKMRRFMGGVVRSFLRRLVADPEASRVLGDEREELVRNLQLYRDEVKSRLNSDLDLVEDLCYGDAGGSTSSEVRSPN